MCPDQKQSCADGQPCCAFDGNGGGYGCCSGGDTEACCSDETGGVCCLAQPTSCIAKSTTTPYPARCCGRETVACNVELSGAAIPRAWQRGAPLNPNAQSVRSTKALLSRQGDRGHPSRRDLGEQAEALKANGSIAYALVVGGFPAISGAHDRHHLPAIVAELSKLQRWGEVRAIFCSTPPAACFTLTCLSESTRPSAGRKVTFSRSTPPGSVDTKAVTGGLVDYVGISMPKIWPHSAAARKIVGNKVVGFEFYWVDPSTGVSEHYLAREGCAEGETILDSTEVPQICRR